MEYSTKIQHDSFIDPLRIIAFISVVVGHLYEVEFSSLAVHPNQSVSLIFSAITPFWRGGAFGVVLFFLISGYVITKAAQRENGLQFLVRRFFRIYPMLLIALGIFWLYQFNNSRQFPDFNTLLGSASLFGDFWGVPNQLGGVDWTLRLEIVFYVVVAVLLLVRVKFLLAKFPNAVIVLVAVPLALFILAPGFPTFGFVSYVSIFFPIFFAGIGIALYETGKIRGALAFFLVIASYVSSNFILTNNREDLHKAGPFIFLGFIVFVIAFIYRTKFVQNRLIFWLASLTYVVYLFHKWLVPEIEKVLLTITSIFDTYLASDHSFILLSKLFAFVFFMFVMSLLVKFVEQPIIRWSRSINLTKQ